MAQNSSAGASGAPSVAVKAPSPYKGVKDPAKPVVIKPIKAKAKRDEYGLVDSDEEAPAPEDRPPAADPTLFGGTNPGEKATPGPASEDDFGSVIDSFLNIPGGIAKNVGRMYNEGGAGKVAGSFAEEVGIPAAITAIPGAMGLAGKLLNTSAARRAGDQGMLQHEIGKVTDEIDFARLKGAIPGKGPIPKALRDRLLALSERVVEGTGRGTAGTVRSPNVLMEADDGSPVDRIIGGAFKMAAPRVKGAIDIGLGVRDMLRRRLKGGGME